MTDSPVRTYVLDTSVLLSDPWACTRFAEHEVVVPLVVISELEAKRHHHELGWFARQALRMFDDLRLEHGRLDQPIPVGAEGGTLQVELNHIDPSVLRESSVKKSLPPLYGALLKNEADVHLFERVAFMARRSQ